MPEQKIYIEFLTFPRLWALLKKHCSPASLFYFDASYAVRVALPYIDFIFGKRVDLVHFSAIEVKDKDGMAVFLRLLYQDVASLQAQLIQDPVFKSFVTSDGADTLKACYLSKASVCYYDIKGDDRYKELWHAMHLVQICAWHNQHQGLESILYINQRPWFKYIEAYAKPFGITLVDHGPLDLWQFKWNRMLKKLRKLNWVLAKRMAGHFLQRLVKKIKKRGTVHINTRNGLLWIEHWGHLNFDVKERQSDAFFVYPDGVNASDLLVSFNLLMDPLDANKLQALRAHDVTAVALTPQASIVTEDEVPVFHPTIQALAPLELKSPISLEQASLVNLSQAYEIQKAYWIEFIRTYGIKLYLTWNKYEANHIVMADAIKETGGVCAVYQRAYEPNSSPQVTIGADIIFGFSKDGVAIEQGNQSRFKYHVVVGYVGDYRFSSIKETAQILRQQLLKAGATRIIAYLDENTVDDSRWFIGHKHAQDNYQYWLEKIVADSQLGIIFKPKSPYDLRRRLGPVAALLEEAEKTGRCIVLGGGAVQGSHPPAAAALAADIAIHECLSAGTAGVESALAGVPTLLVDLDRWTRSPLYQLGPDVVFKNWDETWKATQEFFNNPSSRSRIGNWSTYIKQLDPFNDGKAAMRMSQFLKWTLEGLRLGQSREQAMALAASQYAKIWGQDKIHEG